MWPWEHAAVGYLWYSLGRRAAGRDPPGDWPAVALAVATQFPDLLDKSLSWGLGLFETGYALGHSIFLAIPLGVTALLVGQWRGRPDIAVAVTVGYWSHLVTDVLNPLRHGNRPLPGRVLWPISEQTPYATDYGLARGVVYLRRFLRDLSTMPTTAVLVVYGLLPLLTLLVWLWDGTPGLPPREWFLAVVRRY